MMRRITHYLQVGSVPGLLVLSGCSGSMDVHPCLMHGQVAFELGDVPGILFGKTAPRPHHVWVGDAASSSRPPSGGIPSMWEASSTPDIKDPKRHIIVYGQKFDGWIIGTPAQTLRADGTYRVLISAGPDTGIENFKPNALNKCSAQ